MRYLFTIQRISASHPSPGTIFQQYWCYPWRWCSTETSWNKCVI